MAARNLPNDSTGWTPLVGGTSNAGAVFRLGNEVRRPHRTNAAAIDLVARRLVAHQIEAPTYQGTDDAGNDRLTFIEGAVPFAPFPTWSLTPHSLNSAAQLLRRFHDATRSMPVPDDVTWDRSFADPNGGPVIGHNDACPDNTVFRGGTAVAFIDFDHVAPTDPLLDLAHFARMWVPLGIPSDIEDRPSVLSNRMRAALDGYGVQPSDGLATALSLAVDQAQTFVRAHPSPAFELLSPRYFSERRAELLAALSRPVGVR